MKARNVEHALSLLTPEQVLEAEARAKQRHEDDAARARAKRRTE